VKLSQAILKNETIGKKEKKVNSGVASGFINWGNMVCWNVGFYGNRF